MKTRLVQKIFVFLLITVGVVFILMRVQRTTREPFITAKTPQELQIKIDACTQKLRACGPPYSLPDGNKIYMCDSGDTISAEERATDILDCDDTEAERLSPGNIPLVNPKDTVCYKKGYQGGDVYICFQRPPPLVYNDMTQSYEPQQYLDDQVPYELEPAIPDACATYGSVTNMLFRTFSTTTLNKQKVDTGINTLVAARRNIQNLFTTYCSGNVPPVKQEKCGAILQFLNATANSSNLSSLQGMSTILASSLTSMAGIYNNDIQMGYNGMGCPVPALTKPVGL